MTDIETLRAQAVNQIQYAIDGLHEWLRVEQRRTNVATHAVERQVFVLPRALVDSLRFAYVDAELMRQAAGGDVVVRVGLDVGIHAQGHARLPSTPMRQRVDQLEFGLGLRVEVEN